MRIGISGMGWDFFLAYGRRTGGLRNRQIYPLGFFWFGTGIWNRGEGWVNGNWGLGWKEKENGNEGIVQSVFMLALIF